MPTAQNLCQRGFEIQGAQSLHRDRLQTEGAGNRGRDGHPGHRGLRQGEAIHTERILVLSASLPVIIEAIDTAGQIQKALPAISEMVNEGMIMVTDVNVVKYGKE
jgi:PII-like signaling protein